MYLQFFGGRGAGLPKGGGGGGSAADSTLSEANFIARETLKKANEYADKRFPNLNARQDTNNYWTMDRVSKDGKDIVVKVDGDTHLQKTKYGQALLLDQHHAVFLKDSQVSDNYFGTEVKLNKDNFNVKKWGDWENKGLVGDNKSNHDFNTWKSTAQAQQKAGNKVKWEKTGNEKKTASFQKQQLKKQARKNETDMQKLYKTLSDKDKKDTVKIGGKTYIKKMAQAQGLID